MSEISIQSASSVVPSGLEGVELRILAQQLIKRFGTPITPLAMGFAGDNVDELLADVATRTQMPAGAVDHIRAQWHDLRQSVPNPKLVVVSMFFGPGDHAPGEFSIEVQSPASARKH